MNKKKKISKKNIVKKTSSQKASPIEKKRANTNTVKPKSLLIGMMCCFAVFLLLIIRLAFLQFVQGSELKEAANRQQSTDRIISAKRGNIYDSTGKLLAASAAVDTISINPSKIEEENKQKVAQAFSTIFELDYNEVLEKVNSEDSVETIIKKVEQDKVDELENWMKTNEIYSGINIDEDVKRYYPYGNLASNLIGVCNTDNVGQEGIELKWNSILSGTAGKLLSLEDGNQDLLPDSNENYVPAQNGSNITLTIDANIQTIAEKYLKQACLENKCGNGGTVIIMQPSTGDILAMATYPDFDLNSPREPNADLASTWDTLSQEEQLNAMLKMWRNRAVSDTYEPGSTFKIITAAVGLEEGIVATDTANDFTCIGHEIVNGIQIDCWRSIHTHGSQTLRQALMNSCNPALIQLGRRIGAPTLYKYYDAFGLFNETGIATSGEVSSYFWDLEDVGNVELATMSFGQRFRITPIQLITAISAVANDGVLMQPRLVKEIENPDTGAITTIDSTKVRQVISKETASKLMDMLESVVEEGGGSNGQVKGYSVAGKTGTAEPDENEGSYWVASFVGIAPVQNPEVVVLLALHDPQGPNGHQGGTIAAPVVSQILSEVLPYLGIPSDDLSSGEGNNTVETITLTDVRNKTVAEAKKILENAGFTCIISGTDTSLLVTDQMPKPGTSLIKGASVNLYSAGNETRVSQQVPNLKGMSYAQARNALKAKNLNIHITGNGYVLSQDPMEGTLVEEGTVVNVTLKSVIQDSH